MDKIPCPECGELIDEEEYLETGECPYCGREFEEE